MPSNSQVVTKTTHSLLICEALGFSPQLLLDDIINTANNAVQDGVNGMEEFLQKWADEKLAKTQSGLGSDVIMHEVEQGLVAFQTLLEYHTDIAFDFFEAWCLRNIFMIPSDLPIVLPHQEGLDFTITVGKEQELVDEVGQLRKRLDEQRRLNRYLSRSVHTETRRVKRAETRLSMLDALSGSDGCILDDTLPTKYLAMYKTLSSLPELEPSFGLVDLTEPGKRQWEPSKSGYLNWAVGRLLVKGEAMDKVENSTLEIGRGEDLRRALDAVDVAKGKLNALVGLQRAKDHDERVVDDDRMEE